MKKFINVLMILLANIVYSQSKIYAFVGKKISVERVKSDDSFYLKYKNIYKVEQSFDNEIKADTIVFNSFTHMNQIHYSIYDYAIIYVVKNDKGDFVHKRTYFTPIVLKENGKWYGFELNEKKSENYLLIKPYKLSIKNSRKTAKVIIPEFKKEKHIVEAFYPSQFFEYVNKNTVKAKFLQSAENLVKEKF